MQLQQLEHLIRAASTITGRYEFVVVGSQSILGSVARPPIECLMSTEADIYPKDAEDLSDKIDGALGEGSQFHDTYGYYAQGVDSSTAVLARGWESRLVRLQTPGTSERIAYCIDVLDLFLSKCAANGLFCVSYAGSSTTSAKGLIRSVVTGVDASLNQCPPVQIGAPADTTAPSIPLNITATVAGPGQVNLSWSSATDNVGVVHYNIYRGTSLIASVGNVTSYTDTSPQASTAYSYSVMACDIALNCSGQSTNAQTSTPAQPSVILSPGWNLVGNGGSTAMNVASLFGDTSKVYSLWKWVSSGNTPGISSPTWALYAPGQADGGAACASSKGYESLTSIQSAEGFWVNAKAAFSVPMTAPAWILSNTFQPSQSNALPTGWSLIATGEAQTASAFNKAIGSTPPTPGQIPNNLTTLWARENSSSRWYFYAPSLEAAGTLQGYVSDKGSLDFGNSTLTPAAGLWVNRQ